MCFRDLAQKTSLQQDFLFKNIVYIYIYTCTNAWQDIFWVVIIRIVGTPLQTSGMVCVQKRLERMSHSWENGIIIDRTGDFTLPGLLGAGKLLEDSSSLWL